MSQDRLIALIPAAGTGTRIGAEIPKQYLQLAGRAILWHSVQAFLHHPQIDRVYVVVSPQDQWVEQIFSPLPARLCILRCGGASRAHSVANGLQAVAAQMQGRDWVLVHDAARPGLNVALVSKLIDALRDDDVGGLLALPVVDTVKRQLGDHFGNKLETVAREQLWLAQTPQMFRFQLLSDALAQAAADPQLAAKITDEASAIEALDLPVRLVPGHPCNFKVTLPSDLAIAQMYLQAAFQEQEKS